MKTHSNPAPGKPKSGDRQRRKGVALLTVLTIISLATILILTFFQLAQNEMVSSDSYNNGLEAQAIAEEAVNLVIRQIRMATTDDPNSGTRVGEIGWASQPGVIRTWEKNGKFFKGYKLYSDDEMVVESSEKNLAEDDFQELNNWDSKPWQFVDLNEPVIRGEKVYYPIVDPTAKDFPKWPKNLGNDTAGIEGFDFNMSGVAKGPMSAAVESVKGPIKTETLPMPVKWLYQLKDGTLGHLNDSQVFVPATGGGTASVENPIVARFGYWADDETSKLNPNIHAGGAAWGTPMAGGDIDRNLGRFQPAQHEWQRYPGHPASTHMAPVLAPGIPDITYQRDHMELIFELIPRVVGGGSLSGTRKTNPDDVREKNGLVPDKDRLYASLDEFLLEPGLKGQKADLREPNQFPDPNSRSGKARDVKFMQDQLERSKFFLSVVSRAPETTMFNTPRVSIWPTRDTESPGFNTERHHTPFDRLIRYCAQAGGASSGDPYIYHFQRNYADSSTWDYTRIKRNEDLMKYLEKMTDTKIPGLGRSFSDKYVSNERRQILTEIFDYVRSTNLHDDSLYGANWEAAFVPENVSDPLTYTNPRNNDKNERSTHKGHGQVTPIEINWDGTSYTKGLGRFTTLYEIGVHVICSADGGEGAGTGGTKGGPEPGRTVVGQDGISYPGITQYRGGWYFDQARTDKRAPEGKFAHLSNFPPMPQAVSVDQEKYVQNPSGQPDYSTPYNVKAAAWAAWPEWLRKMVEPQYFRDPATFGAGPDNINPEHDPRQYAPEYVFYAFDPNRWNWQLAWMDGSYADQMPDAKFSRAALDSGSWKSGVTRLGADEQLVQAGLLFQGFCPSLGWVPINPDMEMEVDMTGFTFAGGGKLPDPLAKTDNVKWSSNNIERASHHDRHYGGTRAWTFFMRATASQGSNNALFDTGLGDDALRGVVLRGRPAPIDLQDKAVAQFNRYPFVARPWKITGRKVNFDGGDLKVRIYSAGAGSETQGTATNVDRQLVQSMEIKFPSFSAPSPVLSDGDPGYRNEFDRIERGPVAPINFWSLSVDGINPISNVGRLSFADSHRLSVVTNHDILKSVSIKHGDARVVAAMREVPVDVFQPSFNYNNAQQRFAHTFRTTPGGSLPGADQGSDRQLVPGVRYAPLPLGTGSSDSKTVQLYGDFDNGMGNTMDGPYINKPDEGNIHSLFDRTDKNALALGLWEMARDYGDFPYFVRDWIHEASTPSYFSPNRIISSPVQFGSLPVGVFQDTDSVSQKPWRTLLFRPDIKSGGTGSNHPGAESPSDHYLLDLFWMPVVEPYAISEPLSTGGKVNLNYQILPFKHITRSTALRGVFKSEYMLCVPNDFGVDYKRGVGRGRYYHWRDNPYGGTLQQKSLRTVILEDHTLYQFEEKFKKGEIFHTASEICDIHLVPQEIARRMGFTGNSAFIGIENFEKLSPQAAVEKMASGQYWKDQALVGDNSRERPYSDIYPRVTTKSNTFKVHYRSQILRKAKGTDPGKWEPLVDQVVAEYRGSSIVERYVDPNDPDLPDYGKEFTNGGNVDTIDKFYKFRVINPTRFAP